MRRVHLLSLGIAVLATVLTASFSSSHAESASPTPSPRQCTVDFVHTVHLGLGNHGGETNISFDDDCNPVVTERSLSAGEITALRQENSRTSSDAEYAAFRPIASSFLNPGLSSEFRVASVSFRNCSIYYSTHDLIHLDLAKTTANNSFAYDGTNVTSAATWASGDPFSEDGWKLINAGSTFNGQTVPALGIQSFGHGQYKWLLGAFNHTHWIDILAEGDGDCTYYLSVTGTFCQCFHLSTPYWD